jgi:very-short-patch-repair endonuclease
MAGIDLGAVAEHAEGRLGLITSAELARLGVSPRQLEGLLRRGALRRVGRGVHVLAGAPGSARQRLLAATLVAGPGAVASHLAAAWIWGFDGVRPDRVEVSVPRSRNPRGVDGVVHRVSDLLAVDVTTAGPLPITTPSRTLLDIASRLDDAALEEAFDGARRRGQIYLPFLEWRLAELRRPGRPGVTALVSLLRREHTSRRAESWLESAFLRVIRDGFLPPPRVQVVTATGPGQRVRLDAIYDDQRLVAEVNGHGSHATRRQRQADAERRARLVAMGLRVVDFTYEDVTERPGHIVATLAGLLGLDGSQGSDVAPDLSI